MSLMKDRAEMLELDWGHSFGRQAVDGKGASALKIKKKQTCELVHSSLAISIEQP